MSGPAESPMPALQIAPELLLLAQPVGVHPGLEVGDQRRKL